MRKGTNDEGLYGINCMILILQMTNSGTIINSLNFEMPKNMMVT
jgi:hypothetical protein